MCSHGELRIIRARRSSPIDALEQHRELCAGQGDGARSRLRPHESSALKALGEQAQAIPIPPQHFDPISTSTAEDEQLPGEGILRELQLHEGGKSIEPLPEIGDAGGQPHLYPGRQSDHRRQSSSTSRSRMRVAALPWMRTRPPPARSISRKSHRGFLAGTIVLCCRRLYARFGTTVGDVTLTGNNGAAGVAAFASSSPFWYSRRHPKTRLAFTPCARATIATEAPGLRLSSTIRRFSSFVRKRRGPVRRPRASVVTTSTEVSICAPRGHVLRVHLPRHASSARADRRVMRWRADAYAQGCPAPSALSQRARRSNL